MKKITQYRTADGRIFDTEADAAAHEENGLHAADIQNLLESVGHYDEGGGHDLATVTGGLLDSEDSALRLVAYLAIAHGLTMSAIKAAVASQRDVDGGEDD